MRMQERALAVVATLVLLAMPAAAQMDLSKIEIKAQKITDSVYMLTGAGGNLGVSVGKDGIVVIDSDYAPLAPKIEAALRNLGEGPVRFLLNTHWHGDHTGGNAHFGAHKHTNIVAHHNARRRLAEGGETRFGKVPPAEAAALPVLTFDSDATLHLNGDELRAVHVPQAHTDGDIVIFFTKANVVHMGDMFFTNRFPFIDLDSGGSVRGLIAGIEKVLAQLPQEVRIIPGHGPLSTRQDMQTYLTMLRETSAAVERALKRGRTLEQIKKENVLGKYGNTEWGKGFINDEVFTEILFRSASPQKRGANPRHSHGHAAGAN